MGENSLTEARASRGARGLFYGWWVVFGGAVAASLHAGTYSYGFGAFFTPIINEFRWSRTALSSLVALSRLEGGIFGPLLGYLVDRFGPRKLMLCGTAMMGLGFLSMSGVDSFTTFLVIFVLILSPGSPISSMLPSQAAVGNWFRRKRGKAFGFLSVGPGLGGAIFVPLLGLLIAQYGWRKTAFLVAFAFWAKRYILAICYALSSLSFLILSGAHSLWQVGPFLVLYGPAYGGTMSLLSPLRADYFGRDSFATIHGMMQVVTMLGNIAGPIFAGYVFDSTGSYRLAFTVFSVTYLIVLGVILVAKPPRSRPTRGRVIG